MGIIRKEAGSGKRKVDRIIGYSPAENIVTPIFQELSIEEFKKRYPGRIAVVASQLAEDEDYVPHQKEDPDAYRLAFKNEGGDDN